MEGFFLTLVPVMAVLFTFGIPTLVIIVLARLRHQQRMELIRQGFNPDITMPAYPGNKSLFFGILLAGLGLALIVAKLVTGDYHEVAAGIILLGAGMAFLAFWKLTTPDRERDRRLYEERIDAMKNTNRNTGDAHRVHEETENTAVE